MKESEDTTETGEIEETMMLEATPDSGASDGSKQEKDLALAIVLIRAGKLSERQLSRAVSDWTVYGNESLVDRLIDQKLIFANERQRWLGEADKTLRKTIEAVNQQGVDRGQSQITPARIAHLDSSGRISKLLGLGHNVAVAATDAGRHLFSRFSLIRKLGEGGLGTVWLARDENLRRYVAIKEIRTRNAAESAAAIARFRREAEVTGRLEHPGIVPIYQFGTDSESGRYFYAMRFLGKQTMQDAIAEYHERREAGNDEPLLLHRLISAFVKLCDSVAHAHSRHVVHRDLKPENVALDSFGQVVLLDWGLAKINDETGAADAALESEQDGASDDSLTMASQVLGSPMYMAPEQAAGRIDEIDERTDVYGLGGILFAILTGRAPHELSLDDRESSTKSDLLAAIVGRPSVRAKDLVASTPPELDAICAKATQKKRYLRYASASDIAEDVERYMAGDKVSAYREPTKRKIARWIAAHPKLSQLSGLLAMLFLLTTVVYGYSFRQTQIAQQTFQFQRAADVAKELSFDLESEAEHVVSDARFLNGLPPIQAIIASRNPDVAPVESEAVWRDRLSVIIDGLLRRNESYLAIVFLAVGDDVEEIVKSERNVGAGIIRRVPRSQLGRFPMQEGGPDFTGMLPGDVILQTSDQINEEAPTRFRDALSLAAINAVFDDNTGELFGMVAVQLDLRRMVRKRLEAIGHDTADVFVTDGHGTIQMFFSGGHFASHHEGESIVDLMPELSNVFSDEKHQEVYSDGYSTYATRLRLGQESSSSQADLGIIVRVSDSPNP